MLEVLFLATIATGNCGLDKLDSPVCNSPLSPRFISSLFLLSSLSLFPSFAAISKKHAATTNCALTINPLSTQLIGKLRNRETKNRARVVFIETFLRVLTNRNWTIFLSLFTLFRLVRKFSQTRYQERKRIHDEAKGQTKGEDGIRRIRKVGRRRINVILDTRQMEISISQGVQIGEKSCLKIDRVAGFEYYEYYIPFENF